MKRLSLNNTLAKWWDVLVPNSEIIVNSIGNDNVSNIRDKRPFKPFLRGR